MALDHRDGTTVELAYSDARHRKKGGAPIASAAMHTNSPTPSAITMSPMVSIVSPLHISETAKMPFALAMQTNLPSGRSVRAAIALAENKAISFFPGNRPADDGARKKPMPSLHRWRCCSSTLNWERQYGRHAAPPGREAWNELRDFYDLLESQIATDVLAVALNPSADYGELLPARARSMTSKIETPRPRAPQRGVFLAS